jgi:hypothetical protein
MSTPDAPEEEEEEEVTHLQRWLEASCNKAPVSLEDLPTTSAPKRNDIPSTYAVLLSSISSWPLPKKVQETSKGSPTKIECSVSISFFHLPSKQFYGSTFLGTEHPFQLNNSFELPMSNLNELVYFQTSINDPNCFIVIELVTTTRNPINEDVDKRFGSGWAIIKPFLDERLVQENDIVISSGEVKIFQGTPRELLQLKGDTASILKQLEQKNSSLSFQIWRPSHIGEIIKTSNVVGWQLLRS